jgi:hypothetical protein
MLMSIFTKPASLENEHQAPAEVLKVTTEIIATRADLVRRAGTMFANVYAINVAPQRAAELAQITSRPSVAPPVVEIAPEPVETPRTVEPSTPPPEAPVVNPPVRSVPEIVPESTDTNARLLRAKELIAAAYNEIDHDSKAA